MRSLKKSFTMMYIMIDSTGEFYYKEIWGLILIHISDNYIFNFLKMKFMAQAQIYFLM